MLGLGRGGIELLFLPKELPDRLYEVSCGLFSDHTLSTYRRGKATASLSDLEQTVSDDTVKKIRHVASDEEQNSLYTKLTLGIPFGEIPERAGNEPRFRKSKQEASGKESGFVLDESLGNCNESPEKQLARKPDISADLS